MAVYHEKQKVFVRDESGEWWPGTIYRQHPTYAYTVEVEPMYQGKSRRRYARGSKLLEQGTRRLGIFVPASEVPIRIKESAI